MTLLQLIFIYFMVWVFLFTNMDLLSKNPFFPTLPIVQDKLVFMYSQWRRKII